MSKYGPEFWNGESGAHRRVMMKAAGYGDLDIRTKPHIGVTLFRKVLPELPICVRLQKQ